MISREETKAVLDEWLAGTREPKSVWQWAESKKAEGGPEDDLVRDIIDILSGLPYDLVIKEDGEIMAYTLSNPPEEADLGQNLLWNHFDGLDTDSRRSGLADDPFYGPFAGGE